MLELQDTGTKQYVCMGIAFEVRKNDSEIRKFVYFSHLGKMPEGGYLTEEGYPYSNQEIRTLTEARMKESANGSRAELNRIYPSREAYISTLYDQILGYIDGNRFMTMEKSAIALKMTNGTGQFIRDYMFPEKRGRHDRDDQRTARRVPGHQGKDRRAGRQDRNAKKVREAGQKLTMTRADIVKQQAMIRCIDIEDLKIRIDALLQDQERTQERLRELRQKEEELESLSTQLENELIVVSADLKSSDLGSRQEHLEELEKEAGCWRTTQRSGVKSCRA